MSVLLKEDVSKIFEGVEISEELTEEVAVKLEALIINKVKETQTELEESNKILLEAEKEVLAEQHADNLDKFATYVAKEFMTENKIAIVDSIKVEAAEELVNTIKESIEKYNSDKHNFFNTAVLNNRYRIFY